MSLLAGLRSKIGRVPAETAKPVVPRSASGAPAGPLDLVAGDCVVHYRERFVVVGTRRLEGDGSTVHQYCLRDAAGASAVLVAESGPDPVFSLQRPVEADVQWDADVLTSIADEPFRVSQRGQMTFRAWDDAGTSAASGSMQYREYEDAAGDRVVALEDFGGSKEVRVGAAVFEAELTIERAGVAPDADCGDDESNGEKPVKGSPRAAVQALDRSFGTVKPTHKTPALVRTPAPYDDESWTDTQEAKRFGPPVRARSTPRTSASDDEAQWIRAAKHVRDTP